MFIYYLLLFPYSSTCFSIIILGTLLSRMFNLKSSNSKYDVYSIVFIILFYILNTFFLRLLFSFNTIFSLLHNAFVISMAYFIVEQVSIIGITGQICSGKSTFVGYLKDHYKASVLEIDRLNREVLNRKEVQTEIEKKFGNSVFTYDENTHQRYLDKTKMKDIIFSDVKKRRQLERITHFRVFLSFFVVLFREKFIKRRKYVFVENAILLRFKIFKMLCKKIISVCVKDNEILIERIIRRDQCSRGTAENILKNQMKLEDFVKQSDYVIYNEESESDFYDEIENTLRHLH